MHPPVTSELQFSQNFLLKNPKAMILPQGEWPSFIPI